MSRSRTADGDSHDSTAPAQLIDGRQCLRQFHRIADYRQEHRGAEAYSRRQRRDVCEQRDWLENRHVGDHLFLHPQALVVKLFRSNHELANELNVDRLFEGLWDRNPALGGHGAKASWFEDAYISTSELSHYVFVEEIVISDGTTNS